MAKLTIDNHPVRLLKVREEEYVSLNDIAVAGGYSEPSDRIKSWLRANSTVKFLYEGYDFSYKRILLQFI